MTAYDTTKGNTLDLESVPAGMIILSGIIEMMENDLTVCGMLAWPD